MPVSLPDDPVASVPVPALPVPERRLLLFMPASVPDNPVVSWPVAPLRLERVPGIRLVDESVLPEPIDEEPVVPLLIEPEPLVVPVPPDALGVLVVLPVPVEPVLPELIEPVEPVVPEPVVALPEPVVPLLPIELAEPLLSVPELLVPDPVEPVVLLPPGVVADPVDEPVVPVPLVPLVPLVQHVPDDPVEPVCARVMPAPNASAMPAATAAKVCLEALFMMILQVDVTVRSECRDGAARFEGAPWTQQWRVRQCACHERRWPARLQGPGVPLSAIAYADAGTRGGSGAEVGQRKRCPGLHLTEREARVQVLHMRQVQQRVEREARERIEIGRHHLQLERA